MNPFSILPQIFLHLFDDEAVLDSKTRITDATPLLQIKYTHRNTLFFYFLIQAIILLQILQELMNFFVSPPSPDKKWHRRLQQLAVVIGDGTKCNRIEVFEWREGDLQRKNNLRKYVSLLFRADEDDFEFVEAGKQDVGDEAASFNSLNFKTLKCELSLSYDAFLNFVWAKMIATDILPEFRACLVKYLIHI